MPPWLAAGLVGPIARVSVGPPLFASGPSPGSTKLWSPVPASAHVPSEASELFELAVEAAEHCPPELPATTVFCSVRLSVSTPPPDPAELPATVTLTNTPSVPPPPPTPPPVPSVTTLPVIVEFTAAMMPSLAFHKPPPWIPALLPATVDAAIEMFSPLSDPMPPPRLAVLAMMWLLATASAPDVTRIPPPSPLWLASLTLVPLPCRTVTPTICGTTDPRALVLASMTRVCCAPSRIVARAPAPTSVSPSSTSGPSAGLSVKTPAGTLTESVPAVATPSASRIVQSAASHD